MKIASIKKIKDAKERAIQASLCSDVPEDIRPWFALLAVAIGLEELEQQRLE
mgnify:CR=1 FL=1